jgi:hypothetical protein
VSFLPPEAYTSLSCLLARIMLAQRADLIAIPFVQEHVTGRAKILILRNARSADREKSHGCLLCHTPLTHVGAEPTRAEHLMRLAVEAQPQARQKTPGSHNV